MYLSHLIPYKLAPAELLIEIPPVEKLTAVALLPPAEPVTVQTPVNVPAVVADPVVIAVVVNVPIDALVIFALAMLAFEVIDKKLADITLDVISFTADKLFDERLPVTVTAPKLVLPPELVAVSANQASAFDSPSVGHTYNVLSLVLYQS
jgi:hypothetical protein